MSDQSTLPEGFGEGPVKVRTEPANLSTLGEGFEQPTTRSSSAKLNNQQKAISDAPPEGVDLVIAGAGCGKTSGCLLPRADAIYQKRPGKILILAFNVSVKEELEHKIETSLSPNAASSTTVMTNHGLAYKLVMANKSLLNLPASTEVVSQEWKIYKFLQDRMSEEAKLTASKQTPYYHIGFHGFKDTQLKAIFRAEEAISAQNINILEALEGFTSSELTNKPESMSKCVNIITDFKVLRDTSLDILLQFMLWARINRVMSGKLMFRDLLPLAASLPTECYANLGFKHVLIDEAQDLSLEQHNVIKKLADHAVSLLFVGEAGQCIYRFSGSRPDLFLGIPDMYPDCRVHYLETNYRSNETILDLANYLLEKFIKSPISLKPPHELQGEGVTVESADPYKLVKWIRTHEQDTAYKNMSVLFRKNSDALDVEISLAKNKIPYNCRSGSFFEHKVVVDILAYIKLALGVAEQEDWETVVSHIKFLGKKTAEESWAACKGQPQNLFTAPASCRTQGQRQSFAELCELVRTLQSSVKKSNASALWTFFYNNIINKKLTKVWEERWADDPDKVSDAAQVSSAFYAWAVDNNFNDIIDEIENLSFKDENGVVLSTVHKAKGLEWNHVALWNVGVGSFPLAWSKTDEEEEKCIFYVAVTRARDTLTMFKSVEQNKGTLPYSLESLICKQNKMIAIWGSQKPCEECEFQFSCLASRN